MKGTDCVSYFGVSRKRKPIFNGSGPCAVNKLSDNLKTTIGFGNMSRELTCWGQEHLTRANHPWGPTPQPQHLCQKRPTVQLGLDIWHQERGE